MIRDTAMMPTNHFYMQEFETVFILLCIYESTSFIQKLKKIQYKANKTYATLFFIQMLLFSNKKLLNFRVILPIFFRNKLSHFLSIS